MITYNSQKPNEGYNDGCSHAKLYLTVESITVPTSKKFKEKTILTHIIKCADCPQEWRQNVTSTS
jgi:hypothetical protein